MTDYIKCMFHSSGGVCRCMESGVCQAELMDKKCTLCLTHDEWKKSRNRALKRFFSLTVERQAEYKKRYYHGMSPLKFEINPVKD